MLQTKKFTFICVPKSNTGTTNFNIEDIETIGQFTGLYDKNKVPIYEGDIVEYNNQIYWIEYIQKYARFAGTRKHCVFAIFLLENSEVIGNIYDNSDLLGE